MSDVSTKLLEVPTPVESIYDELSFKQFLSANGVEAINEDILKKQKWPLRLSEKAQNELLDKIKKANDAAAKKEIAEAFLKEKVQLQTEELKKQVTALEEAKQNLEKNLADPKIFEAFVTVYLSEKDKMDGQKKLVVLQSVFTALFGGGYTIQNGKIYKDGREDSERTTSFLRIPKQDVTDAINYTAMIDGSSEVAKDPIDRANTYIKFYNQFARTSEKLDIVITKDNLDNEAWRNQQIAIISGKTFPKNHDVKKQYILNLLSDKDGLYASYNRVKSNAEKSDGQIKSTAGKASMEADRKGIKLPEKLTWEEIIRNPLGALPHFFSNVGGGGTLLLAIWGIFEMFGIKNKVIMYPLRALGALTVTKALGINDAVADWANGDKATNLFGTTVQDGFGWLKKGINGAINYSKEAKEKAELWLKFSNFYAKDGVTGKDIQIQDMNMDKMYQNFLAGTSSALGLRHIKYNNRALNADETTDMKKKLTDLYNDGMTKLTKIHPNMSQSDKEKELKNIMSSKTLRDYIVWVTDIPADASVSSNPPATASGVAPAAGVAGAVPAITTTPAGSAEAAKSQEQQIMEALGSDFEQTPGKLAWIKKGADSYTIAIDGSGNLLFGRAKSSVKTPSTPSEVTDYNKVAKIMGKPEMVPMQGSTAAVKPTENPVTQDIPRVQTVLKNGLIDWNLSRASLAYVDFKSIFAVSEDGNTMYFHVVNFGDEKSEGVLRINKGGTPAFLEGKFARTTDPGARIQGISEAEQGVYTDALRRFRDIEIDGTGWFRDRDAGYEEVMKLWTPKIQALAGIEADRFTRPGMLATITGFLGGAAQAVSDAVSSVTK